MKPCIITVFSGFGVGVMLLATGPIIAHGADNSGMGGQFSAFSAPERNPAAVFDSWASRMAKFPPDLYYHLALGTVGAGICPELTKAIDAKGLLALPPWATGQHFRPSMRPGSSFNWGRIKPTFGISGFHFHSPTEPLPLEQVAALRQAGPLKDSAVPTLDGKIAVPQHIGDDPGNALDHRQP
jgi:hypothetical protein